MAVDGQVEQVTGEAPLGLQISKVKAAVVGLGSGHDMLDVGLASCGKAGSGVEAVDVEECILFCKPGTGLLAGHLLRWRTRMG